MKRNPKIQSLLNEIVNDEASSAALPSVYRREETTTTAKKQPQVVNVKNYSSQLSSSEDETGNSNLSQYDDDQSDDGSIDISDLPPPPRNVKFLPKTIAGLRSRFEIVLKKIALDRKYGQRETATDRNEVVFLLDELKRQGCISQRMYQQYNDFLAESPVGFGIVGKNEQGRNDPDDEDMDNDSDDDDDDDDDDEEEVEQEEAMDQDGWEDGIKQKITSTADYLIEHDKKELAEIIKEIEKSGDVKDTVMELESLSKIFLEREFLERVSVAEEMLELVERLSGSKYISKATLVKINILINDIVKNRKRVKEIVTRFNQAGDDAKDRLSILKDLVKANLISDQQYLKLAEAVDEIDIEKLTGVIRESKIGQGLVLLPRKTDKLIDTLGEWIKELAENGGTVLQNKISALLNELLVRNVTKN